MGHLLEVKNLCTEFSTNGETVKAIENVSFHLDAGEIISIVGESGSGKSVTQMSILQLISEPGKIKSGEIWLNGANILEFSPNSKEMRKVRGGDIAMIFQEPMTSLNPVLTVGDQISEAIMLHLEKGRKYAKTKAIELMSSLGIPDAKARYKHYPDQFSGGMRQRIVIAMAMATNPKILIADEATTALDVTTQAQLLDMLKGIVKKTNTALIIVTHNLGIVARYADRIHVMYAGCILEYGSTKQLFGNPAHPYTKGLIRAIPKLSDKKNQRLMPIEGLMPNLASKPNTCIFKPRCPYAAQKCNNEQRPPFQEIENDHFSACYYTQNELVLKNNKESILSVSGTNYKISEDNILDIQNLCMEFPITAGIMKHKIGTVHALDNVNFQVKKGEILGIVGESGCGKTTLARCILRIYEPTSGAIKFNGQDITHEKKNKLKAIKKNISMIFQDPFSSMNPRQSARNEVAEPIEVHKIAPRGEETEKIIDELFNLIGLNPIMKYRVSHEFSGGQRQRISVARALASNPQMIICDEPSSALDVSVQAQVINLLQDLRNKLGLTYLFISHDLAVVKYISERIMVMYLGKVVEIAECEQLYNDTLHPYTKMLISAIPEADPFIEETRKKMEIIGEIPSTMHRPSGCPFYNRCSFAMEKCYNINPQLHEAKPHHFVACHLIDNELV